MNEQAHIPTQVQSLATKPPRQKHASGGGKKVALASLNQGQPYPDQRCSLGRGGGASGGRIQRRHWFGFPLASSSSSQPLTAPGLKGVKTIHCHLMWLFLLPKTGGPRPCLPELSSASQVLFKATAVVGPRAELGSGPSTALGAGSLTVNRCNAGPLSHGAANKTMSV